MILLLKKLPPSLSKMTTLLNEQSSPCLESNNLVDLEKLKKVVSSPTNFHTFQKNEVLKKLVLAFQTCSLYDGICEGSSEESELTVPFKLVSANGSIKKCSLKFELNLETTNVTIAYKINKIFCWQTITDFLPKTLEVKIPHVCQIIKLGLKKS